MKLPTATLCAVAGLVLSAAEVAGRQRVLVYTKTLRFRHDSIPDAIAAVTELGRETGPGWDTVATEDENGAFASRDSLYAYDAVVFISTTGEVLSARAAEVLRAYLQDGGSLVGIHAASDCMTTTPWFGRAMGSYFKVHPEICDATLQVADPQHPSVSFLKNGTWHVRDEIYTFNSDPRALNHTVLLTVDDGSYPDPVTPQEVRAELMGTPHPLAWYKDGSAGVGGLLDPPSRAVGGGIDDAANATGPPGRGGPGRSWYTSLGHHPETYADPLYRAHIAGGIRWALDSATLRSQSGNASQPGQPPSSTTSTTTTRGLGTSTPGGGGGGGGQETGTAAGPSGAGHRRAGLPAHGPTVLGTGLLLALLPAGLSLVLSSAMYS